MTIKIRYKIIKHLTYDGLEREVQARLNEGWELVGGVSAATTNARDGTLIIVKYQALTKTEEEIEEVEEKEDWGDMSDEP